MRWRVAGRLVAGAVVLGLLAFGFRELVSARGFQLFGDLTERVETSEKVVALTFDDGPHPASTAEVLDVLREKRVPGTFFLIGRDLAAHPELGRRIAGEGHEIGNHTYSHERMVFVTPGFVAGEIERTDSLIRATGFRGEITVRPPHGKKFLALPHYLAEHHRRTITWDVEPNSSAAVDADPARIVEHVVRHVRPGSIVLLHPHYPSGRNSRDSLGPMIDRLRDQGYRFTTVSGLG
ncbi:polysaccharide deacetylase family protein [Saccharopolyspora mangrovi]|uniref:Polysaccharide deacetylase family protein n=1 Tax=Saccharopolyspora mangrovi TaxID=3082379 RepID=A0ABU6A2Z6_9PSEU|nr:polysaccharide deacetylase family protein [Saccharopolyspora sp. S2-29]MEB3365907.1 polysaccharide deacetylase family protein [Saccharopolyspora sp. S2-29]